MVSRVFASRSWREVRRDTISLISIYLTKVTVMVTTNIAWSCRVMSWNIIGEAASWSISWAQEDMKAGALEGLGEN